MNAQLLQQIANPRPLNVPSLEERQSNALRLQSLTQQNELGAVNLQNARQGQQDAATSRAEAAKVMRILGETGGDIEAALPRIAKEAPSLFPHYRDFVVKSQKDSQDLKNSQLTGKRTEQQIGFDVSDEGRKTAAEKRAADAAGQPKKVDEFFSKEGKRVISLQHPDGSITYEVGPEAGAAPQSPQPPMSPERFQQQKDLTTDKSVTPFEQWRKENPAAPIDEWLKVENKYRPQATIAVQTVDEGGNAVTRIVPKTPGSELPAAPTADSRNRATAAKKADPVLARVSDLSEKINTGKGLIAKASGEVAKLEAQANYNDDVAEYEALISGFTPLVARSLGHTGVLTEQDVQSVKALFPKPGDSKSLRDRKVAQMKTLMTEIADVASGTGGSAAPKGPPIGTVRGGYRFTGGDPNDQKNWKKP